MTLTLSGLQWQPVSPALYHLQGLPVAIGFDGEAWRLFLRDRWAPNTWRSRDELAALISAACFKGRKS